MSAPARTFNVRVDQSTLDEIRRLSIRAGIPTYSDDIIVQCAIGVGLESDLRMLRRMAEIFEEPEHSH